MKLTLLPIAMAMAKLREISELAIQCQRDLANGDGPAYVESFADMRCKVELLRDNNMPIE